MAGEDKDKGKGKGAGEGKPDDEPVVVDLDKIIDQVRIDAEKRAADVTKKQLYPQVEKLKEERAALEAQIKEMEAKGGDADGVMKAKVNLLEKRLVEMEQRNAQLERTRYLDEVKELAIATYGEDIVPEMVRGESEEEIHESAKLAHEKYLAIKTEVEEKVKAEVATAGAEQLPVPPVEGGPGGPAAPPPVSPETLVIDDISPEDMRKDPALRDKVLQAAADLRRPKGQQ